MNEYKQIGDSVLVQSKGTETIDFNSRRIIIECSTIYTSSRKHTTKINELLPLHNVQYEKNTYLSGRPIQKKTRLPVVQFGKIMYDHMS